jgi:hypothetical protein
MSPPSLRCDEAIGAQCAPAVLMVRPARFGFNRETAASNCFQCEVGPDAADPAHARSEFDLLQRALQASGVRTCVIDDSPEPAKPDAIFPNNWVSFHADGTVVLYPMQAMNRRSERRLEVLSVVERSLPFQCRHLFDLSAEEERGRYLEGTGSLVLDHVQRIAYVCRSPRSDESLAREWAQAMGYEAEIFDATDRAGASIYHTNVLLAIGTRFAVLCGEALAARDRPRIVERLRASGRELIEIDRGAMHAFAGNVLELRARTSATDAAGAPAELHGTAHSLLVMSSRSQRAFDAVQWRRLEAAVDRVIDVAIPTIETLGGGGVRCMLAEVPEVRG